MRSLTLVFTLLLAFHSPIVQACRQRYIEWYKYMPCGGNKGPIDGECWQIERNMRDYSERHERAWGGSFTADNVCGTCEPSINQQSCTCTIRAWRYREWMLEPGFSNWPKMPNGWERVDPNNGENGWYDTGHKNIDCD